MKTPEIVEHIAINHEKKAFMTLGPRKLVYLKMDVLFFPLTPMRWRPSHPLVLMNLKNFNEYLE
jgi:hypothetical protein